LTGKTLAYPVVFNGRRRFDDYSKVMAPTLLPIALLYGDIRWWGAGGYVFERVVTESLPGGGIRTAFNKFRE
jgi:hypothetical protein